MDYDILSQLYDRLTGEAPQSVTAIKGSASSRRYYLLDGVRKVIGTIGTDRAENDAFIYLAKHFRERGISVPEVLAVSDDSMAYLQTFCGSRSLFDCLDRTDLLEIAMRELARMQFIGAEGLDFKCCFPVRRFDARSIMWDLNYFKYCFLKPSGTPFSEPDLEDDFERLAENLAVKDDEQTFMVRDFQSRNVMIDDEDNVTIIDFQGGRRGPVYYDVASFLWQSRAGFSDELRNHLIDVYLDEAKQWIKIDKEDFLKRLRQYVLLRQLQTLGAYGFRGQIQQKAKFVTVIPGAIRNILKTVSEGFDQYPALVAAIRNMDGVYGSQGEESSDGELVVTVMSFSYKEGIPADMSGNGGGFVFDCRGLHNPGRYDEYKQFTGRDRPVVEFLEKEPDVKRFVSDAIDMVSISVETYLRRGFTSLMVCFGCTGGQHRSVYCAEQVGRCLNNHFNIKVRLIHRERNINETLSKR